MRILNLNLKKKKSWLILRRLMEKREREMLHYLIMITTKIIMLGLEKMIRASTFTLHFALCFYHFVIEIEYKCKVEHVLICEIRVNM